ncbi:Hypothetical protein D9617_3g021030 [Elsinoe fawcettii]|nr:Hypothetical protein D9617_3g021030 [Elsinoe fawcettii]
MHRCGWSDAAKRDSFTTHLIEVAGLLDLPSWTLGRKQSEHRIWSKYVAPFAHTGIEPTTGLPRSLLAILAQMGVPDTETRLLAWPGERGEDYAHQHLWEAVRCSAVLHNRAIRNASVMVIDNDVFVAKILAAIDALLSCPREPFKQALGLCVLYPLFTAGLYANNISGDRSYVAKCFEDLIAKHDNPQDHRAYELLGKIWSDASDRSLTALWQRANQCATDLDIELYLG